MKVINQEVQDNYALYNGDSFELIKTIPDGGVDFITFSPPFSSLYVYSDDPRDLSNTKNYDEFLEHFNFMMPELYRILKPGRMLSFHVMNLTTTLRQDGFRAIVDLRGDLIREFQKHGFRFHSEVAIWKDPELAAVRTKNPSLLYRNFKKDATKVRQGLPDYLITLRKDGEESPVTHDEETHSKKLWANYASPVWMDINPSDTLQRLSARGEKDEKHITPTQLEVFRRAIDLWTNPNDIIFSPFMGIGSEGYVAIKEGRRFIGFELKESYFEQAVLNLKQAELESNQLSLTDL